MSDLSSLPARRPVAGDLALDQEGEGAAILHPWLPSSYVQLMAWPVVELNAAIRHEPPDPPNMPRSHQIALANLDALGRDGHLLTPDGAATRSLWDQSG